MLTDFFGWLAQVTVEDRSGLDELFVGFDVHPFSWLKLISEIFDGLVVGVMLKY